MIEMNKKKNEETKGFPKRLDRIEISFYLSRLYDVGYINPP